MRKLPSSFDPHFDAEHGVLRNLPGLTKQTQLDGFEGAAVADALVQLYFEPVRGQFDRPHLQEIHRRIFAQVYPWAGELRQVNIARSDSFPFAAARFLELNLDDLFKKLSNEKCLRGKKLDEFALRCAFYMGELNAIHPFREGNGRTQREFVRELGAESGFRINWNRIRQKEMYEASARSHNQGDNSGLAKIILFAIEPALGGMVE
jgi:cell filamentation protein